MVAAEPNKEEPLSKPWLDPPARFRALQRRLLFSSFVPFVLALCIAGLTGWRVRNATVELADVGRQKQELSDQTQSLQAQLAQARADLKGAKNELGYATEARNAALQKLDITHKQVAALEARESRLATILSVRGAAMEIHSVVAEHKDGTERERAVALVERGKREVQNNNIDLATLFFDRAAQEDPKYAGPYIELSRLTFAKNSTEAEKLLLNAAEVEPSSPWPPTDLVDYYLWKKDLAAANVWAEKLRAMKNLPGGEDSPRKVLERYDNKVGNRPDAAASP